MVNLICESDNADISLHRRCRLCGGYLAGFEFCCIGLCKDCHSLSFQVRRTCLPASQQRIPSGWRGLLSYRELARWREWQDKIIERVDREAQRSKGTKLNY